MSPDRSVEPRHVPSLSNYGLLLRDKYGDDEVRERRGEARRAAGRRRRRRSSLIITRTT